MGGLPTTIQKYLALAIAHHQAGRLSEAEMHYRLVVAAAPDQPFASYMLGVIAHEAGNDESAFDLLSKAIAVKPDLFEAHNALGMVLRALGRLGDAVDSCHKALAIKPDYAEALNTMGLALRDLETLEDAAASLQKALSIKPNFADAHSNLGLVLHDLGKLDEAVASYRKALAIKPDYAEAHNNLGNALRQLRQLDGAVECYGHAIASQPDYAEAHSNLGLVLYDLGKLNEAISSFNKALAINPDYVEVSGSLSSQSWRGRAHCGLGNAFKVLGMPDEAAVSYQRALVINPDFSEAHSNLGNALKDLGRLDAAVASYRKALTIKSDYAEARSNLVFTLGYDPKISSPDILQEAKQWQAQCGFTGEIPKHQNMPDPDRRLRVGLVSGDLRRHSVSFFLENVLAEIDKDKLELFSYATFPKADDVTARLKKSVAQWRTVVGVPDDALAAKIREDRIDVLVDLSGHTAYNRLAVFSRKPAPLQVTWLGYGGTTGVDGMDYILCDPLILPRSEEAHYTEKPWRLPEVWMCFSPPGLEIDVGPLPALADGFITFGSFNNLTKVSGHAVACWARVLEAVPNSRLVLKALQLGDATVQESIVARFTAEGIDPQRLAFHGHFAEQADHLRAYQKIDIALDPFPYSGGTTTAEALWMGTPVLTLRGERYVSHMGESLIHNAGLDEWISETPEEYVEKAMVFAADLLGLAALRGRLRGQLVASPVCDAPRFARNLEDAFRGMWWEWCGNRAA
jgi:protein O-GlcNAc transferase